ncbi:MAG: mechanosensitive ion channel [Duncaniella sp.]|nr:mechanosensitive ion channel [Duncaniella sp.]
MFQTTDPAAASTVTSDEGLKALKTLSLDDLIDKVAHNMVQFAISLAIAIFVFYVGKFIIRKLYNLVEAIMVKRNIDKSLTTFVLSLVRIVLYFILIVTVIGILGIETSSFLALFASAGVAIGMALSGTLQNFAGGVLILLLKPYRIGDYIEAQGYAGTVTEIEIFNTIICTADNKSIIIPNGGLSTGSINNYSRQALRRVDWTISISYGDNVEAARKAILDMLAQDSRILTGMDNNPGTTMEEKEAAEAAENAVAVPAEVKRTFWDKLFKRDAAHIAAREARKAARRNNRPRLVPTPVDRTPVVKLASLGASSVDLTVRAWVASADYWGVFFDFNERFYNELPAAAGISFPFPQMDVHVTHS